MDILSIAGIVLAITAIVGGNLLDGGHTSQLIQLTAFLIVVGGTTGAVMLQTSFPVFLRAMNMLRWVIVTPEINMEETILKLVNWSEMSRREGLLALENASEEEQHLFPEKVCSCW